MSDFLWQKYPDQWDRCTACDGTGKVNCANCGGKGKSFGPHRELFGGPRAGRTHRSLSWKPCRACGGEGKRPCGSCVSGSRSKTDQAIGPTAEIPQTTLFEKRVGELLEDNKKASNAFSSVTGKEPLRGRDAEEFLQQMEAARQQRLQQQQDDLLHRAVSEANEAWRQKDFTRVVSLLTPFQQRLGQIELKKLAYALKRAGGDPKGA